MDDRAVICKSILGLSETVMEGIGHIRHRAGEGRFEDTADLFTDVVDAFHEVHRALLSFLPGFTDSELERRTTAVIESMKLMLAAYEGRPELLAPEVPETALAGAFTSWHDLLREDLGRASAHSLN